MRKIKIQRGQLCPVCGGKPHVLECQDPWHDYLAECETCGFSYDMLGDFAENPEEALELWDYDVAINGLTSLSVSETENETLVKYWKEQRAWYLQKNKKKA